MIIECEEYQVVLNDGTNYKIICSSEELDKLIMLIGESNIIDVRE
jgi:hypothetical protein